MIPQETVNLILDTVRVEDIVGDYVALKRRGVSFVACCPFHNEKTPSFHVTPSRGIYKCFGCGKGGSAVNFVMEMEHCSYPDALRHIARRYHIEVVEAAQSAEEIQARQRHESLMLVMEFAQKFYVENLKSGEGHSLGYAYYRKRGIEDATMEKFGLGWAPSSRSALTDAALQAGYKAEYLIDAGLSLRYDDGRLVDKFRERAMFPIHSLSGRVIAYSGRTLKSDPNIGKYVNSSDSDIYHKSKSLFGIFLAKSEIARQDRCILVEGNVDVVSMHQLGITNVVASCGTALTVEQVRLIARFTKNITIIYDGDKAGIKAALRGLGLVLREGLNVKVVLLPDGDDPDSYSRKHTLEEVQEYIRTHEQDFTVFKSEMAMADAGGDPVKRAELINDIADTIALIPDAVKRTVYVQTISDKFGVDQEILFNRIKVTRSRLVEEERAAEERERRRGASDALPRESGPATTMGDQTAAAEAPAPETQQPAAVQQVLPGVTNRIVAPVEKEILFFLLNHGTDTLDFESDSELYSGDEAEKPSVADFILDSVDQDGGELVNPLYQRVYAAYAQAYDEGLSQEDIVRGMANSSDTVISSLTAELCCEKYELTVEKFEKALMTTSSWLVSYVPKAMHLYIEKKLESNLADLSRKMSDETDPERLMEVMQAFKECQETLKMVKSSKKR